MTTVEDVAAGTYHCAAHIRNLLVGVRKGYRAAQAGDSSNPYGTKQGTDYRDAWQFGHDHCGPTIEDVEESWLAAQKAKNDRFKRTCAPSRPAIPAPVAAQLKSASTSSAQPASTGTVLPFPVARCKHLVERIVASGDYDYLARHRKRLADLGIDPALADADADALGAAMRACWSEQHGRKGAA